MLVQMIESKITSPTQAPRHVEHIYVGLPTFDQYKLVQNKVKYKCIESKSNSKTDTWRYVGHIEELTGPVQV